MANDNKKHAKPYVDPNPNADYGAAMAKKAGNPSAVEWQNANNAAIAAATTPKALASHVWDAASAEALLARVKGAYTSDPLDLTVIGAVSQYVMEAVIHARRGALPAQDMELRADGRLPQDEGRVRADVHARPAPLVRLQVPQGRREQAQGVRRLRKRQGVHRLGRRRHGLRP